MDAQRKGQVTDEDYAALAEFRYLLRRFMQFSEDEARRVGLTGQQHQALLAIKGFGAKAPLSVGDLAERLCIRHHSAGELVNRLADAGLIERRADENDHRRVRLALTETAERHLKQLSAAHLDELSRIGPMLRRVLGRDGESRG